MSTRESRGALPRGVLRVHYAFISLLLAIATVTLALGLGRFAYTMILPAMRDGLGLSNTQAGLLATANLAGYMVAAFAGGILAARLGARLVIGAGSAVVAATMILTGAAGSFEAAVALRFLTGLGSAACLVSAMGLLAAWFRPRRRGLATGGATGGTGIGLVLGGAIVPYALSSYAPEGWRQAWYFLGGIGLLLGLVVWLFLRDAPREMGLEPFGPADVERIGKSTGDATSLGGVYRAPALYYLGAVYAVWGFSYIIFATFFAAFLAGERGYGAEEAGAMWATAGVISIASGVLWGGVSDAIGRRGGLAIVLSLQALCFLAFSQFAHSAALWAATALFGLTAWSVPGIMAAAAGDAVGPRLAAAAVGLITLMFGVGQAAGPWVAGFIADRSGSLQPALLLAAGGAALGAVMALGDRGTIARGN